MHQSTSEVMDNNGSLSSHRSKRPGSNSDCGGNTLKIRVKRLVTHIRQDYTRSRTNNLYLISPACPNRGKHLIRRHTPPHNSSRITGRYSQTIRRVSYIERSGQVLFIVTTLPSRPLSRKRHCNPERVWRL